MTLITDSPRLYKGSLSETWWLALTYEQSDDDPVQFIAREKIDITDQFKAAFAKEMSSDKRTRKIAELVIDGRLQGMSSLRDVLKEALGSVPSDDLTPVEKEAIEGMQLVIDSIIENTEKQREMLVQSVRAATQQKLAEQEEKK